MCPLLTLWKKKPLHSTAFVNNSLDYVQVSAFHKLLLNTILPKVFQVFQSLPWQQEAMHLGMQTALTDVWERVGFSQELSGTMIVIKFPHY